MGTKFCRDCKHFKSQFHFYCHHPKNVNRDLVTGDLKSKIRIEDLRTGLSEDYCGEKAIWFEPKENLPKPPTVEFVPQPAPRTINEDVDLSWFFNIFKRRK